MQKVERVLMFRRLFPCLCLPLVAAFVPRQISLACGLQGDSEVTVTWITDDSRDDDASCAEVAVVEVKGPFSSSLQSRANSASVAFSPSIKTVGTCLRYSLGTPPHLYGNYTSGRIHRVQLNGLVASSTYYYSVYGDEPEVKRHFKTLPASEAPNPGQAHDPRFPFAIGVIGDLGQTADSEQTVRHLEADSSLQLLLHAGDMSYADTDSPRWDSYAEKIEPLSSRLQWMVCPGNHEIESDHYTGDSFKAYEARFAMPAVQPAESKPSPQQVGCQHPYPDKPHEGADCTPSVFTGQYDWGNSFYAFDAGPARVISLNSYTYTGPGSAQYMWLRQELEALERRRSATPWLIVMMHCPFYTSNAAHHEEMQAVLMRDAHGFEDLLHNHKVAVVLSGHVHAYERSSPVYKNRTKTDAPTYLVVGDGGNREGHAKDYLEQPNWSAFRNGLSFGHGRLLITNKTHMLWEWKINDGQAPTLGKKAAARRAADLTQAGAKFPESSSWYLPLPGRSADDNVWIINPYSDRAHPPSPPPPRFDNANLLTLGLVAAAAAVVVASVMLIQRCRKRRAPADATYPAAAEMQSTTAAEMQGTTSLRSSFA